MKKGGDAVSSNFIIEEGKLLAYTGHLQDLVVPNDVTSIAEKAFFNNITLRSIILPEGFSSIEEGAFRGCENLKNILIPNTITNIDYEVFEECNNLEYNVYDNACYLGNNDNPYLVLIKAKDRDITSCEIYPNTRLIHHKAFSRCENLTNIDIPKTVISIGSLAFIQCSSLSSVTIPDEVSKIGNAIFHHCNALRGYVFDNAYYVGNEENPYRLLVKAIDYDIITCEIHKDTKYILDYAFRFCENLTELTIPEGLKCIKKYAFIHCTNLEKIILPKSLVELPGLAFYRCTNLKKIFYKGTSKDFLNSGLFLSSKLFDKVHYYCETKPSIAGKYWHYDKTYNILEWK